MPGPSADRMHPPIAAPLGDVTTERLDLRRFQASDLDEVAAVFAKPEVWQFPFGRGYSRDETQSFLDSQMAQWQVCGFGLWAAVERASGRMLGFVGLSVPRFLPEILPAVEVGWRFDPAAWGRGYATEGATAALDQAFSTMGLDQVCAIVQSSNDRSIKVAERLGLRLERPVTVPADHRRGPVDARLYVVTREEWQARHPS